MKSIFTFEIGKLDRGLFRIWIVAAIVWIAFVFVVDTFDWRYKDYQEEKSFNFTCKESSFSDFYFLVSESNNSWFRTSRFTTLKECQKVANRDKNNFYLSLVFAILSPLSLIIIWLYSKKIFLWIYRGFK